MDNIRQESSFLSNAEADIDKVRRKYTKTVNDIFVTFVSPYMLGYEKYRHYLLKNSTFIELPVKYHYRPDYLSYDLYNTTIYWTVLLFLNNISSIEDFTVNELLVPEFAAIAKLANLNDNEKDITNLDDVKEESTKWPKIYRPSDYKEQVEAETEEVDTSPYRRETFVMSLTDITNEYVLLNEEPIEESVVVRIKNEIFVPLYDVHYIVTTDDDGNSLKLSWSNSDTTGGSGLVDILLLDSVLEVQYQVEL